MWEAGAGQGWFALQPVCVWSHSVEGKAWWLAYGVAQGLFGVEAVSICCWPVGTASMANMAWEVGVALVLPVTPCNNSNRD